MGCHFEGHLEYHFFAKKSQKFCKKFANFRKNFCKKFAKIRNKFSKKFCKNFANKLHFLKYEKIGANRKTQEQIGKKQEQIGKK